MFPAGRQGLRVYGMMVGLALMPIPSAAAEAPLDTAGAYEPESPGQPEDPACDRCHSDPEDLKTSIKDPACLECHLQDDERIQAGGGDHRNLPLLPVAFSPGTEPNPMVHIPEGAFPMGRSDRTVTEGQGNQDESPIHRVYVSEFMMDKFEVTNLQYRAFVDATGHRVPRHWKEGGIPPGKENHPVNYISWFDANDYCHWVGKRLPSESEWEKAARGADGLRFPWGNTFDPMKANTPQHWLALEKEADTTPVGSFEGGKSPYGLYDMAGNLYEWTANWYKPYPQNAEPNVHYGTKNKIVRGGSWYDCLSYGCGLSAPTFNRSRFAPVIRNKSFGFRCAKSI
jgi:formylglycine-generating enzyme required for sulfatase activity